MKLWQKNSESLMKVQDFTVGNDQAMDMFLAPFDVMGSIAHGIMLESIGLLEKKELDAIVAELKNIHHDIQEGNFQIEEGVEDIHSQVELLLTKKLGDVGKKIHSGRSRNDQVMVDIKLFLRNELKNIITEVKQLFDLLLTQSEKYKEHRMPGYTHFQLAMPSSFGLWFAAYAESLVDDIATLQGAYKVINRNPLGSAAGYGSSFPLNRQLTTDLLGFDSLNYNVIYAQMGRGKTERVFASAISNVASTLNKLAADSCLFMNQNFGFISFPDELTTGSSIMPHKKNPDVFELIRARCNQLAGLPNDIALITTNLPSGYHRDLQLLKEVVFPAIQNIKSCLKMTSLMISNISVKENLLEDEKYSYMFSVEEVNRLVLSGMPFRDAYKKVGNDIEQGKFQASTQLQHTHEGSIGNLCNDKIAKLMTQEIEKFNFQKADEALGDLLK
jgi:argininosuccinate lyase